MGRTCLAAYLAILIIAGLPFATEVVESPLRVAQVPPKAKKVDKPTRFAQDLTRAIHLIATEHVTPAKEGLMTRWALQGLYKKLKEPIPANIARPMGNIDDAGQVQMLQLIQEARANLGARKELNEDVDLQICLQAIFANLEGPAPPEERSCFVHREWICILPAYVPHGVGLKLTSDPDTGMLRVLTPILNSPAYEAGIRAGDLVTHIRSTMRPNGESLPEATDLPTKGMSVEDAERLLLGRKGTRVTLRVVPAGKVQRPPRK